MCFSNGTQLAAFHPALKHLPVSVTPWPSGSKAKCRWSLRNSPNSSCSSEKDRWCCSRLGREARADVHHWTSSTGQLQISVPKDTAIHLHYSPPLLHQVTSIQDFYDPCVYCRRPASRHAARVLTKCLSYFLPTKRVWLYEQKEAEENECCLIHTQ